MAERRARRVVVTGLGAVSPFGAGVPALERGLRAGKTAIDRFDLFENDRQRTHVAGQVPASAFAADASRAGRIRSRTDAFAEIAADEALRAARLSHEEHAFADTGLFFGSSTGGIYEVEEYYRDLKAHGARGHSVRAITVHQTNSPGDAIARRFAIGGPVETISSACAAATLAIGAALDAIRAGEVDLALAGGADGLCRLTYSGFNALRAVDESPCRPFRPDRQGLSLGEGAGLVVLESEEHARRRGATILLELAGAGASCDAHHMTAPHPEGLGAARAIKAALDDADLSADDVDLVNAHGTGTPLNDASEWEALRAVFGERAAVIPLTSTKSLVGHLLGACGAIEAVATILCLTGRWQHAMPARGDDASIGPDAVLAAPRTLPRARIALTTNFAFGGANAALLFRSLEDRSAR